METMTNNQLVYTDKYNKRNTHLYLKCFNIKFVFDKKTSDIIIIRKNTLICISNKKLIGSVA